MKSALLTAILTCLTVPLFSFPSGAAEDDPNSTAYSSQGDVAAGEKVFKRCKACHVVTADAKARPTGPRLYKVIGRTAGSLEEFRYYSKALKAADHIWTEERLFEFLKNPNEYVPGIKSAMRVQKIADEQQRKDLLAYLREATSEKSR